MIASAPTAEVALGLPLRATFHYGVPAATAGLVGRGAVVIVPFGRRFLTGYVVGLSPPPAAAPGKLKAIQEVLAPADTIGSDLFELAEFAADYYLCPLGEVLRAALPTLSVGTRRLARLTAYGAEAVARVGGALAAPDRLLLAALAARGPLTDDAAARVTGAGGVREQLRRLEVDGLVVLETRSSTPTRAKTERDVQLVTAGQGVAGGELDDDLLSRSAVLRRVVDLLTASGGSLPYARLRTEAKATPAHVRRLVDAGRVQVIEREVARDLGPARTASRRLTNMTLNADQQRATDRVVTAAERGEFAPFLLHGVTGSGKTLVYLSCIEAVLGRGRSSIILVPEIALTPVLGRELRGRFGDQVALLHSGLATGERYDAWRRVASGQARVVFGARSAVFAPARDLGLIVVDEEHDSSYKQGERPHYHARDLAVARAKLLRIPIVLGSATPSLESYQNAVDGRYELLELAARAGGQTLPTVEIVDLRDEFERVGGTPIVSQRLEDELAARVAAGEQAVLLLNRRGYACFLLCRECGHRAECPNCSVCLTYHRGERLLKCHHCDHRQRPTEACSKCGGRFLNLVGHGTEKVETVLRERLPQARVARLDRDTVRGRHDVEQVLGRFERGEVDILVGTQMVAKGHDFPNVTLVGVISVDAMLALPDFRSTERAFSLLTQVAGRAGRGDRPGLVLLQTYHPENEAVRLACAQDYKSFYEREIRLRRLMRYPPIAHLANLILKGEDRDEVMREARGLGRGLEASRPATVRMLGPAMAPVQRLKRSYRTQILLKGPARRPLRDLLRAADDGLRAKLKRASLDIDVDPQDLL